MYFGDNLIRLQRGLERRDKKVRRSDDANASLSCHHDIAVANTCGSRHFRGGICMSKAAADGSAIPDLIVLHVVDHELKERMRGSQPLVLLDLTPAHARADSQALGSDSDLVHTAETFDVDQRGRI